MEKTKVATLERMTIWPDGKKKRPEGSTSKYRISQNSGTGERKQKGKPGDKQSTKNIFKLAQTVHWPRFERPDVVGEDPQQEKCRGGLLRGQNRLSNETKGKRGTPSLKRRATTVCHRKIGGGG